MPTRGRCANQKLAAQNKPLLPPPDAHTFLYRDEAGALSLSECVLRGGHGSILVDRLLPELAYKLGRAAKYGA